MGILETLLLPALLPAIADGLKVLWGRITGGVVKPATVDDQVKLMNADIERLKALAALDAPAGTISPWVADLRASFRYVAAGIIIVGTLLFSAYYFLAATKESKDIILPVLELFIQMSGSVFSFMFGDRVYLNLKKK
jgi:hypothetical protein